MERRVDGSDLIFEIIGFTFEFEPYIAINGDLKKPVEVLESAEGFSMKFDGGSGMLKAREALPNCLLIEASIDGGYSQDGVIIKLRCRIKGYEKILLFHFAFDPDKYFGESEEPFVYPKFREVLNEKEYCAWNFPACLEDLSGLSKHLKISQMLFEGGNSYAFLLPISNEGARGLITEPGDGFSIVLDRGVGGKWSNALVAVISVSEDPYKAVEEAYEVCFNALGKSHVLRRNKELAEPFKFLGWCSWNAMWTEPNERSLLSTYEALAKAGVKLGFLLIDDGWQAELKEGLTRSINSLNPDPKKFPAGFEALVKNLKSWGVRYVGLWHTLNMHWSGVTKGSELAKELGDYLMEVGNSLLPKPCCSFELYRELYRRLRRAGFDFVKVDNQSFVDNAYRGKIPVEEAARGLHEGLEGAAHINALEVLNCMAQQPENQFNWLRSTVSRNCIDYIVPHKKSRNKLHLYFNAYNSLWMSQIVWPDWDMFQSHDPWALQQAVARAISGGPVYITDSVKATKSEIVKPLCFSNARLPLPDHPALPTVDIITKDPYNEVVPLKVFTKVTVKGLGTYGIVAAFNVNKDDETVKGNVSPSDALLTGNRFLTYEYFTDETKMLEVSEKMAFEIGPMGVRLYVFSPVKDELAVVGLKDVYIMPRGVVMGQTLRGGLLLELYEPGRVLIWGTKSLKVEGGSLERRGDLHIIRCEGKTVRVE